MFLGLQMVQTSLPCRSHIVVVVVSFFNENPHELLPVFSSVPPKGGGKASFIFRSLGDYMADPCISNDSGGSLECV